MNVKRHSAHEIAQADLFGASVSPGVGARQASDRFPAGGGGYQDMCGTQNFSCPSQDPRFAELRRIGLPRMWLILAETVGFDAFLEVWRRLTIEGEDSGYARETGGVKMPSLRSYDAYLRYQRNRYIDALAARGLKPAEVRRAVARNLSEPLDEKHVFKLMNRR